MDNRYGFIPGFAGRPLPEDVMQAAAGSIGVSVEDIRGRSREEHILFARALAVKFLRELCCMSFGQIARAIDHETSGVSQLYRRFSTRVKETPELEAWIDGVTV